MFRTNKISKILRAAIVSVLVSCALGADAAAEDGYRLWMRYDPLPNAAAYRTKIKSVAVEGSSATSAAIRQEFQTGLSGLLGEKVSIDSSATPETSVLIGTPENSAVVRSLKFDSEIKRIGPEGFVIRNARVQGRNIIVIASVGETGALYGAFHFLRLLQTGQPITTLNISQKPDVKLRILDQR
jgi:alpha-glucuronidase